jgi:putative NADPH-quinone reductase
MNILVVLAHPNRESFNHAIAKKVVATIRNLGHNFFFHDLYAEKFDPVLSPEELKNEKVLDRKLQIYCDELIESDGLIFVHPNWWGQPPAILKGWIDRVFQEGVAYEFTGGGPGGVPRGLLTGKTALVFNTSDTPDKREKEFFGDPLDLIWKKCLFEFCGISRYFRTTFCVMAESTLKQRQQWFAETEAITAKYFPA